MIQYLLCEITNSFSLPQCTENIFLQNEVTYKQSLKELKWFLLFWIFCVLYKLKLHLPPREGKQRFGFILGNKNYVAEISGYTP